MTGGNICWRCRTRGEARLELGWLCDDCAAEVREEPCRSGFNCGQNGGHGSFLTFCEDCAEKLAEIGERLFTKSGAVREPKRAVPAPEPKRTITAAEVEAAVRAVDGPLSTAKLAAALDVGKDDVSFRAAINAARNSSAIMLLDGRGYLPGDAIETDAAALAQLVRDGTTSIGGLAKATGRDKTGVMFRAALEHAERDGLISFEGRKIVAAGTAVQLSRSEPAERESRSAVAA